MADGSLVGSMCGQDIQDLRAVRLFVCFLYLRVQPGLIQAQRSGRWRRPAHPSMASSPGGAVLCCSYPTRRKGGVESTEFLQQEKKNKLIAIPLVLILLLALRFPLAAAVCHPGQNSDVECDAKHELCFNLL